MISVSLPIKLVSEANAHEFWRVRQRRAKTQRFIAAAALRVQCAGLLGEAGAAVVTITRIAPRSLDDDNLAGSAKHVRDGVADALGINDRDPRVQWRVAQERGLPKDYAVIIRIEAT